MSTRDKNIRLKVNDQELSDLAGWLAAKGLQGYPRSSAMRLFQMMVLRSSLKPTEAEIKAADVVKVEKGRNTKEQVK